jgi:HD-like signal output (HDOD) protein
MDMQAVVQALGGRDVPVLGSTVEALRHMRREEDRVTAREISRLVLRDPLMTLKALRFAEANRGNRQSADITTVEHVVMMHGIHNFLRVFVNVVALEDVLANDPVALDGARAVVSRAQHSAAYARSIAYQRHDSESDEVVIGALLHDLAELMLWLHAPRAESEIRHLLEQARGLRSAPTQQFVLGFTHMELQLALAKAWRLPDLLQRLMDDDHADHPRVINVALASRLARHLAHGWFDPALPDDYADIQKLLNGTVDSVRRLVRNASLHAAKLWEDTGVRPVAAWIPMEEGEMPREAGPLKPPPSIDVPFFKGAMVKLSTARASRDADPSIAWAMYALQFGLGMRRVAFARPAPGDPLRLQVQFAMDLDATSSEWQHLALPLGGNDLFARIAQRMQGVWAGGTNRAKLASHLLPVQADRIGRADFLAMSIFGGEALRGMMIADRGVGGDAIPDSLYAPFKALCMALSRRFGPEA